MTHLYSGLEKTRLEPVMDYKKWITIKVICN